MDKSGNSEGVGRVEATAEGPWDSPEEEGLVKADRIKLGRCLRIWPMDEDMCRAALGQLS